MRMQPSPPRIPRWALYGGTCALTMAVTAWVQLSDKFGDQFGDKRNVVTLSQPASAAATGPTTAVSQPPFNTAAPAVLPSTQVPLTQVPLTQVPLPIVLPHVASSGTTAASPVVGTNGFAQPAPEAPPADPDSERAGN